MVEFEFMRIVVYEFLFEEDVFVFVVIDEVVDMVSIFGIEKVLSFVNGIFGRIVVNEVKRGQKL